MKEKKGKYIALWILYILFYSLGYFAFYNKLSIQGNLFTFLGGVLLIIMSTPEKEGKC